MWNGVGGSTNVYGALWPRYRPSDFRKGTEHGLQPDWPISYEDLRPYYDRADRLIGVSGLAGDPAMPPQDDYPTPPLPMQAASRRLAGAFDRLGWHWWPVPAGVISRHYDGRKACHGCGICNGCPRGSMSKFSTSVWPKALEAGVELRTYARVLRIEKDRSGRATGAEYIDRTTGRRHFQKAERGHPGRQRRRHAAPAAWPPTTSPTAPTRSAATCCTTRWSPARCGSTSPWPRTPATSPP